MACVSEVKEVGCQHSRVHVTSDLVFEFLPLYDTNDSRSQIDDVAEDRELFSRAGGSYDAREALS